MSDNTILIWIGGIAATGTIFCAIFAFLTWRQGHRQQSKESTVSRPANPGWLIAFAILFTGLLAVAGVWMYSLIRANHSRILLVSIGCFVVLLVLTWLWVGRIITSDSMRSTPPPAGNLGNWKPKWQKLQSAYAERERLEGELHQYKDMYMAENIAKTDFQKEMARAKKHTEELETKLAEATKPNTSFRARTIAMCDGLHRFLKDHGPEPSPKRDPAESDTEYLVRVRAIKMPWQERLTADYKIRFSSSVPRIRDEIRLHSGWSELGLDQAIERAESYYTNPEDVEDICKHLWRLAYTMTG